MSRAASAATVRASNTSRTEQARPAARTRATRRVASREWPPSAKKSSSAPTDARPRTSANASARRFLRLAARGAGRRGGRHGGRGQGGPVQLAVDVHRQDVQGDDRRRDHVRGQAPGHRAAHRVRVGAAGRVRHQARHAGDVLADQDGRRGDALAGRQLGLDLAEFDAEAADLDLVVGAAEELDQAVGAAARQVARAVHAGAGGTVRVGREPLGGEHRTAQVAAGVLDAREVQLAGHAGRHRPQPGVQDVRPGVVERAAHHGGRAVGDPGDEGVHRELGGTVVVHRLHVGDRAQLRPQGGRHGLAAEEEQRGRWSPVSRPASSRWRPYDGVTSSASIRASRTWATTASASRRPYSSRTCSSWPAISHRSCSHEESKENEAVCRACTRRPSAPRPGGRAAARGPGTGSSDRRGAGRRPWGGRWSRRCR